MIKVLHKKQNRNASVGYTTQTYVPALKQVNVEATIRSIDSL